LFIHSKSSLYIETMKIFTFSAIISFATAFAPATKNSLKTSSARYVMDRQGLVELAKAQNNIIEYYDPLSLAERSFWETTPEQTIGFLRHAEIKHGRVAMAAFVGYCVQSNGYRWPFDMKLDGTAFPSSDLSPEAQWDAIPEGAKWQILLFVGFLELLDESSCGDLEAKPHYMRGGEPGRYPSFDKWINLYDPFGLFKNMDLEKKARRRNMEINNGRLAMIGIFSFLAADSVPGSVPLLESIAKQYDGNVMIPFGADFSLSSVFAAS